MPLLLIVIYIVFISLGLPDSLFGVAWPVVHLEFGIHQSFASVYGIVTGVCTGGASFVAGWLLRKFGTGKVTFFSILLTVAGLVTTSFAPNIVVMMICSVIMGYGAGAIDTGLNNYVSLHYEARHMNWLHCFWGVGVTVSPMIMSRFLGGEAGGWRSGYRAIALIQLSIALLVLVTLKLWNKTEETQPEEAAEAAPEKSGADLLRMKGVLTGMLSLGFYCGGEFLLNTWGASYAVNVFGIAPDVAARWVSLFFCGIMLGRMIAGFVSVKASDNTLIYGGVGLAGLGILVLLLPIGSYSLVGLLLIGMGYGPIFPSVIHSIPARFGVQYSPDITGYHMGCAYAVGFAVQLSFGFVASATTFRIMPFVLVALCLGVFAMNRITTKALAA